MSQNSAIEWTEATWNPTTGCTKVSPACAHCYIERTPPFRMRGRTFVKGHITIELHPDRLDTPLKRRKPTVYFVNSLSDLFHEDIPDAFIDRVFAVMALTPQHTYQVLTKRPERMRDYLRDPARHHDVTMAMQGLSDMGGVADLLPAGRSFPRWPLVWPMSNVWLGVSVENQHFADTRIPLLLDTPAAVRFLSCEPLLGPVSLYRHVHHETSGSSADWRDRRLGWVIAGGESGPTSRPSNPDWFRSLRDECQRYNVPFFFKQWGGFTPKSGGRLLDGRVWDEKPHVSEAS